MLELEPINNQGRKCLCCGYIRIHGDAAPTGQCPHCQTSYGKHHPYENPANAKRFATRGNAVYHSDKSNRGGILLKSLVFASVLVIGLVIAKISGVNLGFNKSDNNVTSVTHTIKVVSNSR